MEYSLSYLDNLLILINFICRARVARNSLSTDTPTRHFFVSKKIYPFPAINSEKDWLNVISFELV